MFLLAYGRAADAAEIAGARAFLDRVEAALVASTADAAARRRQAWQVLCHTTLAANEFVYVR